MSDTPRAGRGSHTVGIGGAGMIGNALVARVLGAEVTGSDRAESTYVVRLRARRDRAGDRPPPRHVPEGQEVELVYSTAPGPDKRAWRYRESGPGRRSALTLWTRFAQATSANARRVLLVHCARAYSGGYACRAEALVAIEVVLDTRDDPLLEVVQH